MQEQSIKFKGNSIVREKYSVGTVAFSGNFDPLGIPLIETRYFCVNCKLNIPNGMKNHL